VLPGRPAYYAVAKLVPGFEAVPRGNLAPPSTTDAQLKSQLVDAMSESKLTAQIVAERAAGFKVPAVVSFIVVRRLPRTPGSRCFRVGDRIVALDGRPLVRQNALVAAAGRRPAGARFDFGVARNGHRIAVRCATALVGGKHRFGILIEAKTERYSIPVPVTYHVEGINGSSAGLMFALQIYRILTGRSLAGGRDIAGTGVLNFDGTVAGIEGAREKARAAIKAGATIFLVPKEDYAGTRGTRGIAVIGVSSFADAIAALNRL